MGAPETLRLDLYDPVGSRAPGGLVVVHGGASTGGQGRPGSTGMAQAFAAQARGGGVVDHRLRADAYPDHPVASLDAQHDVQAGPVAAGHAPELRVDPGRIAVTGTCRGHRRCGSAPTPRTRESGTLEQPRRWPGVSGVGLPAR